MTTASYAVVQSGVVINMIVADSGFAAPLGTTLVPSSTAQIEWNYDGSTFAPPAPPAMTKAQLIAYAMNKAAAIEAGGISVNIAASGAPQNVECASDTLSYARVSAAAAVAIANPSETVVQVFPSGVVTLTAAQVEAIFAAISNFYVAVQATLGAVVTAIAAGTITTTAQIDAPPSPLPAWPNNS